MHISIDTNEALSATDREILSLLMGGAPAPAVKAAPPAAKAKAKAAEPEPEPEAPAEEEEDLLGGGDEVTMEDAVAAATKLVSEGRAAEVKEALGKVGAKRVSEIKPGDLAAFVKSLG